MNILILSLIIILFSVSSSADEEKTSELAAELFRAIQMDKQMENKALLMKEHMEVLTNDETISEQEKERLQAEFSNYVEKLIDFFRSEEVMTAFEESYAATFSDSEMQALIDFYTSPAGLKFLEKSPELTREFMRRITPELLRYAKELEGGIANVGE